MLLWGCNSADESRVILRENRRAESAAAAGHPARDGDCEKIRAGISAAARRVALGGAKCPRK